MTRRSTFALLSGLYVSQYLGIGFFFIALPAILRARGVALEVIGLVQALGLTWALKFLWAPAVDRFGSRRRGHYRSWLLVLQPAIAVALLALIPFDVADDVGVVLLLVAGVVLLSATQDIAADAIAVRVLDPADRGLGNGVQNAGGYLGNLIGGGGVLVVYDRIGWPAAMITLAALTLLPAWQVWRYREPDRTGERPTTRQAFGAVWSMFQQPGVAVWALLVLPLCAAGAGGAYSLSAPALVDAGWSLSRIGLIQNVVAGVAAIVAALASGALVSRFGPRRVLLGGLAASALAIAALLPLARGTAPLVATAGALSANYAGYTVLLTVVYTVNMSLCRERCAGSDYTVLGSVTLLCSLVVGGAVVAAAGTLGYPTMVLACAALTGVGLLVAAVLPFTRRLDDLTAQPLPEPVHPLLAEQVAVVDASGGMT